MSAGTGGPGATGGERLDVRKTYKLYIGGAFPRSESGHTFTVQSADGAVLAQASKASRKDLRDAVGAARAAQPGWAGRTAYNRGQILYRIAEMVEGRRAQFEAGLVAGGAAPDRAAAEVDVTIDRWVWYAGWCDKIALVAGSVDPVAGPYFTFTVPGPAGVVGVFTPATTPLAAFTARVAPAICAGNAVVAVCPAEAAVVSIDLAEALATSDLPGGVVNVLTTSDPAGLAPWLLGHGDVDSVDLAGIEGLPADVLGEAAAGVTRVRGLGAAGTDWLSPDAQSFDDLDELVELKTVWHPTGI